MESPAGTPSDFEGPGVPGNVSAAIAAGVLSGRLWLYANYHCNLACSYCLTESASSVPARELGTERLVRLAEEGAALGFTAIGVTGGEPFLLSYLPDALVRMAGELPVVVLTNGTLFSESRLERLRALAGLPLQLQISLDRPDPVSNDAMRGPRNFRRVVQAIPRLVDLGIRVRLATTVERIDEEELTRLCELHRSLGVADEEHVIRPVVRRGRARVQGLGVDPGTAELDPELTITADGAFWSPFGPTVMDGRLDTDLLVTRTTAPLALAAEAIARLAWIRPRREGSLHFR
jgi:sulfatase maturation enzyme AslB (radical SAM superfamily)